MSCPLLRWTRCACSATAGGDRDPADLRGGLSERAAAKGWRALKGLSNFSDGGLHALNLVKNRFVEGLAGDLIDRSTTKFLELP